MMVLKRYKGSRSCTDCRVKLDNGGKESPGRREALDEGLLRIKITVEWMKRGILCQA